MRLRGGAATLGNINECIRVIYICALASFSPKAFPRRPCSLRRTQTQVSVATASQIMRREPAAALPTPPAIPPDLPPEQARTRQHLQCYITCITADDEEYKRGTFEVSIFDPPGSPSGCIYHQTRKKTSIT